MKSDAFDLVCLFGSSPHFSEITTFLDALGIKCLLIYGPRQTASIQDLVIPASVHKMCVHSLDDVSLKEFGISDRKSLGISFGSPFIFTQQNIDNFDGQLINSHGAPLPEFKGGGGFSWRILQCDKRGTVLMHYVTTKIDEGACVFRKDFVFADDDRMPCDYEKRQFIEEAEKLIPWIKKVVIGQISLKELSSNSEINIERGSYFPRLSSDFNGCIDWAFPLQDLERFVLAFSRPYPGAYTFIKGQKAKIFDLRVIKKCYMHPFTYGLVLDAGPEDFLISCNGGIVAISYDDITPNKNDLRLNPGDRFYTPGSIRERALSSRVFYSPGGLTVRDYI